MAKIPLRPMGKQGLMASMQGFGCMGLTAFYGNALEYEDSVRLLEKAVELGVTHFDSAEMYVGKNAKGEERNNEVMLGKLLKKVGRDKITFATKFWPGEGERQQCTEKAVREAVEGSLKRLEESSIDLYYLHRIPSMDGLKSFMTACKALVAEGKIKYVGISEATPEEIRAAHAIHPLTAIQQEWSLVVRNLEKDLVPTCRELGIAVVAYSPLCRGLTSGLVKKQEDWSKIGQEATEGGGMKFQTICTHLTGDNLAENVKLLQPLEDEAAKLSVTPAQLSLAWLHCQGEDVFPIPGTTKEANLAANAGAAALALSLPAEVVERVGPRSASAGMAGERYPAAFHSLSFESRAA